MVRGRQKLFCGHPPGLRLGVNWQGEDRSIGDENRCRRRLVPDFLFSDGFAQDVLEYLCKMRASAHIALRVGIGKSLQKEFLNYIFNVLHIKMQFFRFKSKYQIMAGEKTCFRIRLQF